MKILDQTGCIRRYILLITISVENRRLKEYMISSFFKKNLCKYNCICHEEITVF